MKLKEIEKSKWIQECQPPPAWDSKKMSLLEKDIKGEGYFKQEKNNQKGTQDAVKKEDGSWSKLGGFVERLKEVEGFITTYGSPSSYIPCATKIPCALCEQTVSSACFISYAYSDFAVMWRENFQHYLSVHKCQPSKEFYKFITGYDPFNENLAHGLPHNVRWDRIVLSPPPKK